MQRDDFTELMTHFPSGVAVVTATDAAGVHYGLTLTAFCSLSATPPLVLVCIDRGSNTLPALRESCGFTVNLLAAGHQTLANHFASKRERKFHDMSVRTEPGCGPILHDQSCAYLTCSLFSRQEVADHEIIVGLVQGGGVLPDREPLVYGRRRFGSWPWPEQRPDRVEVGEGVA